MPTVKNQKPKVIPSSKKKSHKRKVEIDPSKLPSQILIEDKLKSARISLLCKEPFFGSMATSLKLIRDDERIDTAATDGEYFYYNLSFIASLTLRQTEFLFGHEVLHNVFEHHLRKEKRNHSLWNIACDYAVNNILINSKIGDMIENLLYDTKYSNMCAEEIYEILYKNFKKIDIESLTDKLLDEHLEDLESSGNLYTEEKKQQIRTQIRESLINAAQCSAGNLPSGVDRYLKSITEPKMNWKELLRQDIQSIIKTDYSFYRPSKKGRSEGIVLPGMIKENSLDICIAIDTSGSIRDDDVSAFLSEIKGIMSQYTDYNIRLWCFDTEVHNEKVFRSDENEDINTYKIKGGGGTLYECNFEHMIKNDIQPKIFIMFTDMYPCNGWGTSNYCENVIFVAYKSNNIAPYGTTIKLD